jgi:NAD kinase
MAAIEKIVVVTKKSALQELIERFNTREQARFYVEQMGASFDDYAAAHDTYIAALETLKSAVPKGVRVQFVERGFLPSFTFAESDLVVTVGPDGLVVNTAKYLSAQPLLALNPDPARIDGILVPFRLDRDPTLLERAVRGRFMLKRVSMAKAELNDGQVLYALNDLFVGQQTHVSARYHLRFRDTGEDQSSSGIIVSTGAGSTGWLRSILTGAAGVVGAFVRSKQIEQVRESYPLDWEAEELRFSVREPFVSHVSSARLVFGRIGAAEQLHITSLMPQSGVIFSDGVEVDYLQFNSGAIARIGVAEKRLNLVVGV